MEDLKLDTNKLNNDIKKDLPEVPRLEDGKIDVEKIATGKDDKGRWIVPDDILENFYKDLPDGTTNEAKNKWVYNGGLLNKATREVQKMGAEALNAKNAQRRTFAEVIEEMLVKPANAETLEDLNLKAGATNLDAIIAAAFRQAGRGNVKALDFLRDTVGQKPSEKISAEVTALTPEDKELLERVSKRLDITE